jgi:hypothetical protein
VAIVWIGILCCGKSVVFTCFRRSAVSALYVLFQSDHKVMAHSVLTIYSLDGLCAKFNSDV